MGIATGPLACYLVEWYRPGLDDDGLRDFVAELSRASTSVSVEGSLVRCLWTLAVPSDDVAFGIFTADSSDKVALVCRRAGMPVSRLSAAVAERPSGPEA
jgi:hypothetical protein